MLLADSFYPFRDRDVGKGTAIEGHTPDLGQAGRQGNRIQLFARRECAVFNPRHPGRDIDRRQTETIGKGAPSNPGDAV